MFRRSDLAVLAVLAFSSPGLTAPVHDAETWRYTASLGASLLGPRMGNFNQTIGEEGKGFQIINEAAEEAGAQSSFTLGQFRPIRLAWGGQLTLLYEFNEELRGGLLAGADPFAFTPSKSTATLTDTITTTYYSASTLYQGSLHAEVQVYHVGAAFQKMFRFEEAPSLRLYLGGWAQYGLLFGRVNGKVLQLQPGTRATLQEVTYKSPLDSRGWGAGGTAGVEYVISPGLELFGESGYQTMVFRDVQERNSTYGNVLAATKVVNNARRLEDSYGRPVTIDLSGLYVRIGIRGSLKWPSPD